MSQRADLRATGAALRARLFPNTETAGAAAPGFADMTAEMVYGGVWSRPGLSLPDRMICTLAVLGALERHAALRRHVGAALELGLAPRTILEVFVHCGLYAGFVTTETAVEIATAVFAERGVPVPADAEDTADLEALSARGRECMETLHGSRARQGYAAPDNPVTGLLYPTAIQYGYGVIWFRGGLERRQRALCAVAAFTALRMPEQAKKFGQSALNVGVTRDEVIEAVIQTGPFSGFPTALNALAALSEVL